MAPLFTLRTLGVPQLLAATGESIRFRTRKHFALAIRLGVEPGRPLTRDHLIELLWSSSPPRLGRHSLAQAVTVLKAKLGRTHILVHKSTLTLAPGVVDCDVTHLDDCSGGIEGPFLESFEIPRERAFDDWRDAWHAKLLPRMRDCLVRMMDGGRRIGDFVTVERHAQVLADLDPLSEDALRGIMEARAWVGDRTNALKAYAQFETRLARELGARPSPELARIANLLREGRRSPYRQPSEPPPEAGEKRFEPERVIGREKEFSQLYDAWIGVRRRQPCVMVVTGDPGIGKTTLTNAFVSTCQMEGAVVARAQAYDAERELPFAVLAELVRQLTIQRAIGSADPDALSELSRICADVLAAFPGVPKPVEWSAEITPLRLADAFLKTISAAAEDSPLVLVVDDVHAADNASVAILHLVARKLGAVRFMLLMAGRTGELRSAGAAGSILSDRSIGKLYAIELESLTPESATAMVAALGLDTGSKRDDVVKRILDASNGYPLALEILARERQAHGSTSLLNDLDRLNTSPSATLGIPRAIRALFEKQVDRLDQRTRSTLELAAVLGRRIGDLSLYEVISQSPREAADALAQLCEEGLLRQVHGELEFKNELIRAQAYYAVAPVTRQLLHRQAAGALLGTASANDGTAQAEIAWHYLRGAAPELALEPAMRGVNAALASGAPNEAEKLLEALAQCSLQREASRLVRLRWCRALVDQSRAPAALAALEELLRTPLDLAPADLAEATMLRATAEYLVQRETGRKHFEGAKEALHLARSVGDQHLTTQALFEFARSGAEAGDEGRVRTALEQLTGFLNARDRSVLALTHYGIGYCSYFLYDVDSAASHLQEAVQVIGNSNPVLLGRVYTGLGNCFHTLCNIPESGKAFEQAMEIARRLGDDCRLSINTSNLSALMLLAGDFEAAVRWGVESTTIGERALNQPMLQNAYGNLSEAYLLSGRPEDAFKSRERAREWVRRERSWLAQILHMVEEACHELILGNWSRGLNLTVEAERLAVGHERAVPSTSSFETLKTLRLREMEGSEVALHYVAEVGRKYRDRVPLAYLPAAVLEMSLLPASQRRRELEEDTRQLLGLVPGRTALYRALTLTS